MPKNNKNMALRREFASNTGTILMFKKLKDTTVVVGSDFLAFVANFELGDISLME